MDSFRSRLRFALILAGGIPLALACSKSVAIGSKTTPGEGSALPLEITHEDCDTDAKGAVKSDVNNDGRADITRVVQGNRESCRVLDLNFDGRVDNFLYFDEAGNLRRRESDFDRDGLVDEIGLYKNGKIVQKFRETNLDGKLDTWDSYTNERLTERMRDINADGKVDQWWTFPDPTKLECPVVAHDEDGDGKPDARHDPCKEREAEVKAAAQPWEAKPAAPADAGAEAAPSDKPPDNSSDKPDNPSDKPPPEPTEKDGGS